ncbi:MAG TPA: CPBP family intramembrane glutamic endopeptidase [Verrucomicrobiae bacterium]|nr:CPBP family intramembrane glutamic endopeptidase [Verrucomicrobiae bacterium]
MVCAADQQPLPDIAPLPPLSTDKTAKDAVTDAAVLPQPQTGTTVESSTHLMFPDYRWSARDAWKCMGMIVLVGFLVSTAIFALRLHFHGFRNWQASGSGYFSRSLVHYAVELFAAAYFARTETFASFCTAVGLDRKPSNLAWFGVVAALALRVLGHFVLIHGWSKGVRDYDILAFQSASGPERYLFLGPLLLLAPLFEESIYRGFLYKALRGSFSLVISMALIVAWTAYSHWSQYSVSWVAALDLSVLTILQCYLREKSDSLWDCIICHMAFNGSLIFLAFH